MEEQVSNPLVVRCNNCGGDQYYDISKQKYCCSHCGSEAEASEKKAEYRHWKSLHHGIVLKDLAKVKTFSCPSCGAQTMATGEDASAQCPFCQNTMIDAEFAGNDVPEVIIPFKLNKEEALERLNAWLSQNKSNPAAKLIEKNRHRFTGCYLPYHIVRGAYNGRMSITLQDGTGANYPFRAYLNHTAVNASKDWDNLFLDGIEPFDFNEAREFDFGYLNHQNAKIQNVVGEALNARVSEETRAELYQNLTKKVGTKELTVILDDDENESIPALLPVYLVKCKGGIAAAVNGQNGKVSIATGKTKNLTSKWWLWPLLSSLVVSILASLIIGEVLAGLAVAAVFGLVFFAIAHNRHHKELIQEIITLPKEKASHNDTQTEFVADFGQGPVPAKLKFFTPWRIIKTVLIILAVIFLPVLIAIPIQILRWQPLSDIRIGYGAAWYCIPGFFAILAAGGLAKAMMYGAPLYYEILPNGKTRQRKAVDQNRPSLKELLSHTKLALKSKLGCLVIGFIVFLLVGSVCAMIM